MQECCRGDAEGLAFESGAQTEKVAFGVFNTLEKAAITRELAREWVFLPANGGMLLLLASDLPPEGLMDNVVHLQLVSQGGGCAAHLLISPLPCCHLR